MGLPVVGSILELGKTLIERVIPDPKQKAEALMKLKELELSGDLQVMANQVEINKLDAASGDAFARRWRPFTGWVCGSALAIQLVVSPVVTMVAQFLGKNVPLVQLDVSLLSTLLIGMLGLGGMRTVEKLNDKTR